MFLKKMSKVIAAALLILSVQSTTANIGLAMESNDSKEINLNLISSLSNEDIEELKTFLSCYGVDDLTIVNLINKLQNGELLDSINPEKQHLGIVEKIGNEREKVTYPDGSIVIKGIDNIQNRAISGGTVSSGTGYSSRIGARIYHNAGLINCEFYADYTNVQGGYDIIEKVYRYDIRVLGGSFTGATLAINKKYENSQGNAWASLRFKVSTLGLVDSIANLDLFVGRDTAYTRFDN